MRDLITKGTRRGVMFPLRIPALCALVWVACSSLALVSCSRRPRAARPNVVLVVIDTLRADHTSLGGYERPTTPAIDAWATGGTVFERAWAASSWTLPSMNMLLTGQVTLHMGGRIAAGQEPLAEVLSAAGYRAGGIVGNGLLRGEIGFERGFEHYELVEPEPSSIGHWTADEVVAKGLRWVESLDGRQPFFLYLHLIDPHAPYDPKAGLAFEPRHDAARQSALRAALPEEQRALLDEGTYRGIESFISAYDSEILQADAGLQRLFDWLAASGLESETLLVLTSDHGEGLWQRAVEPDEKPKPSTYFPALYYGHGDQLYSEQVHVPLVLRGPGVPIGARRTDEVSLLDVLPTLLAILDLEPPGRLEGRDLFADNRVPHPLFSITTGISTLTVGGRWRLHLPSRRRMRIHALAPALYDLQVDPLELRPVQDPERQGALREGLLTWRRSHAKQGVPGMTREEIERLRRLGYAGQAEAAEEGSGEDE